HCDGAVRWPAIRGAHHRNLGHRIPWHAAVCCGRIPVWSTTACVSAVIRFDSGIRTVSDVCCWENSEHDLRVNACRLMTDAVEKVTVRKLWNRKTQQSNREEWFLESTLRAGA